MRKQKLQVQEYVTQLEKQLPGKAEMDALLSDINQAGLGRGLQFELFRPGQVQVKDYYAELPIAIRVSGRYHDIGSFAADVANLSRIVTLQNLSIGPLQARDASGAAGHGSHRAHLSLSGRGRDRRAAQGRRGRQEDRGSARNEAPHAGAPPLLAAALLAGCSAEHEELREWMERERREVKPKRAAAAAAEEIRPRALQRRRRRWTRSARRSSPWPSSRKRGSRIRLLSAELNRRQEPLEAYPLDSMSMVGSVNKQGQPFALLRVDNLLYQVKVGDYLGQNYGRITQIDETEIALREIVQDAAGEWIERPGTLQLQEKAR